MLLLIDNYDSFTYTLASYFEQLGQSISVYKNDELVPAEIETLSPTHLILSPGPKAPDDAGICLAVIQQYYQRIPILGICLGHQCLSQAFGGKIIPASEIVHGKTSPICHNHQRLFTGIPSPFIATRYHSLAVDSSTLPDCFHVDAWADKTIMAISHRQYSLFGLQFHPEALLTTYGMHLLQNFCTY